MTRNSLPSIQNINSWRFRIWKKNVYIQKNPYEDKYQLLIDEKESTDLKCLNDSKSFIEYPNDMDDIYKNIEEYSPKNKRKILIAFDDVISNILSNTNLNPRVTE